MPFATVCKTIKYQTYEEDIPGTVIGTLAEDLHLDPADFQTSFRLMKQFNSSLIKVRENDGQLTIGDRIDREQICKQSVQCLIAFDVVSFSKEQFKLIHVEVEVRDINDNSPTFPNSEISVEISENAAVGTRIPLDIAIDEDVGSNSIQTFQISVNSHFSIEVHTRADTVKYAELLLMKELDRETQASYLLELLARDGGNPSRSGSANVNIKVIDSNDNSPVFDKNSFTVKLNEDSPVGFLLLNLNAVDADEGVNGEVVYGFGNQVSIEIRQLFKVDSKTGCLTLEGQIDYETKNTYELDIQAHDLGPNPIPATCKVIVQILDVNDNAPEISITPMTSISAGVAYITEAAAKDSFVALISTSDRDSGRNGQVHCTLYGHDHFKLQQAYDDSYMIVTTTTLDRERISEYNLTVVAEDLGSPPFKTIKQYTIRVSDENDNTPLFPKPSYEVSILENNTPGAYITTVVARDPDLGRNGKVIYRLIETEAMGAPISTFVSVDPATGAIYALRAFNYETMKQLEVRIQASDGGFPQLSSSALIKVKIVDQNDNAPYITHPALKNGSIDVLLPKKAPSGFIATQIKARDADEGVNSELTYRIVQEEDQMLFAINKGTGEIFLTRDLPDELTGRLQITLTVNDNGRPSLYCTATINFIVTVTAPSGGHEVVKHNSSQGKHLHWDLPLIIIIILAGSCTLLLVAIIAIATTCNRHKKATRTRKSGAPEDQFDISRLEKGDHESSLISSHRGNVFEVRPFPSKSSFSSATSTETEGVSSSEDDREQACLFEAQKRLRGTSTEGYSTVPSYDKEPVHQVAIWKGNSFSTIATRDAEFSGKDSGKGDSDFNDSDSDISGDGLKKDTTHMQNGLWACTSECKILGHSDRCWSPSSNRANPTHPPQFSSFPKTASLPRDHLRRENYYQAQIPKTVGLQSVYEKVLHRDYEKTVALVSPPRLVRIQELNEINLPMYKPTPIRCHPTQCSTVEDI
ncbi:protocadherin-8 [Latimeria chalumnae]|uniref:protocadherin-8 n=1 Tax=Latimeria chalumnae TaxID=7897 RepID=UPI0003C180A8